MQDSSRWKSKPHQPVHFNYYLTVLTAAAVMLRLTCPDNLEDNSTVRVLILRGAGEKAFCGGYDMTFLSLLEEQKDNARQVVEAILGCSRPVIAMVNGDCLAPALFLLWYVIFVLLLLMLDLATLLLNDVLFRATGQLATIATY